MGHIFSYYLHNIPDSLSSQNGTSSINTAHGVSQELMEFLQSQPLEGNTIIGSFCLPLLDIAAMRGEKSPNPEHIEHIIVYHPDRHVQKFLQEFQAFMLQASNRYVAKEKIIILMHQYSDLVDDQMIENILHDIATGVSWLSSDDRFYFMQAMIKKRTFVVKQLDLQDTQAFEKIAYVLQSCSNKIDSVIALDLPCDEMLRKDALFSLQKLARHPMLLISQDAYAVNAKWINAQDLDAKNFDHLPSIIR
jgi:hypothetical protein